MEVAERLERETGKPVVTSNQATLWAALLALEITTQIDSYGRLLRQLQRA
jgi:maleate isomerase